MQSNPLLYLITTPQLFLRMASQLTLPILFGPLSRVCKAAHSAAARHLREIIYDVKMEALFMRDGETTTTSMGKMVDHLAHLQADLLLSSRTFTCKIIPVFTFTWVMGPRSHMVTSKYDPPTGVRIQLDSWIDPQKAIDWPTRMLRMDAHGTHHITISYRSISLIITPTPLSIERIECVERTGPATLIVLGSELAERAADTIRSSLCTILTFAISACADLAINAPKLYTLLMEIQAVGLLGPEPL
jgi:hypothetical protein